jgi:hypothetical protein
LGQQLRKSIRDLFPGLSIDGLALSLAIRPPKIYDGAPPAIGSLIDRTLAMTPSSSFSQASTIQTVLRTLRTPLTLFPQIVPVGIYIGGREQRNDHASRVPKDQHHEPKPNQRRERRERDHPQEHTEGDVGDGELAGAAWWVVMELTAAPRTPIPVAVHIGAAVGALASDARSNALAS